MSLSQTGCAPFLGIFVVIFFALFVAFTSNVVTTGPIAP